MIAASAAGAALAAALMIYTCYDTLARRAFSLFDLVVVAILFANVAAIGTMAVLKWAGRGLDTQLLWIGGLALAMTPCLRGAGWAVGQVARQKIAAPLPRGAWIAAGFFIFPACVLACGLPAEIGMLFAQRVHESLWAAILASGLSAMLLVRVYALHSRGARASSQAQGADGKAMPRT